MTGEDLHVLLHGEVVATMHRTRSGNLELAYASDTAARLSVSMRPMSKPHRGEHVSNWIDNLIPDDERIRRAWAKDNKATSIAPFDLLSTRIGEDCAGAVQFVLPDRLEQLQSRRTTVETVDLAWIERRLARLRHAADNWHHEDHSRLMYSIGGLQPKMALHMSADGNWARPSGAVPTTHIFKPAPRREWPHLDLNEHLMLTAAQSLNVPTAFTRYRYFGAQSSIVVSRFDRLHDEGQWIRLHAEDLCQAFGLRPGQRVEDAGGPSSSQVARLLRANAPSAREGNEAVERFGQALALNWVILGSDAHAKNYTLLHQEDGTANLAPLYDVSSNLGHLSETPADHENRLMAMRIGDDYTFGGATRTREWLRLARGLKIDRDFLIWEAKRLSDGLGDRIEAEIARLGAAGHLRADDKTYCSRMMKRFRTWQTHLSRSQSMKVAAKSTTPSPSRSKANNNAKPNKSEKVGGIKCGQPLDGQRLCQRVLANAVCPKHKSSPGSRRILAQS